MTEKQGSWPLLHRAATMLEELANALDSAEKEIAIEGEHTRIEMSGKSSEEVSGAKKLAKEIKHFIEYGDGGGE